MPTIAVLMLICTVFSITWCRRPTVERSDINQLTANDHSVSISNISEVYDDIDSKRSREPPPKYSEIFKNSIVDKLPTYKSFREKKIVLFRK